MQQLKKLPIPGEERKRKEENREGKRKDLSRSAVERGGEGSRTWRMVNKETNRENIEEVRWVPLKDPELSHHSLHPPPLSLPSTSLPRKDLERKYLEERGTCVKRRSGGDTQNPSFQSRKQRQREQPVPTQQTGPEEGGC